MKNKNTIDDGVMPCMYVGTYTIILYTLEHKILVG